MTLFGDIGGFSGFLMTLLGLLVGAIPNKLFNMRTTKRLFKIVKKQDEPNKSFNQGQPLVKFCQIKYDAAFVFKHIVGCFQSDSKHQRILDKGSAKIERMLDI